METNELRQGSKLRLEQKPELATHLVLDEAYADKAICGASRPVFASYSVAARVGRQMLLYDDGSPAFHHVDCKRCRAIYLKHRPAEYIL